MKPPPVTSLPARASQGRATSLWRSLHPDVSEGKESSIPRLSGRKDVPNIQGQSRKRSDRIVDAPEIPGVDGAREMLEDDNENEPIVPIFEFKYASSVVSKVPSSQT